MSANFNTRDANDLIESRTDKDRVMTNEELTKRVEGLEAQLLALSKKFDERNKIKIKQEEENEILSDDEESIVDEADNWAIMFRQLREYRVLNGDCIVPMKFAENPKLASWVNNQKTSYRHFKTGGKGGRKIMPDKIVKLESIGFFWGKKYPPPASWDDMFDQLQNFQKRMGNCNVPFNEANPTALAKWVAYQCKEYKRFRKGCNASLLTLDQIEKLNDIGMNWKGPKL